MKLLLYCFLFAFHLQDAFCQVSGKLTTPSGQPIPFANVLLLQSVDSSFIRAVLTDDKGGYQVNNIGPGKFILQCSSIGYQTWNSPVFELTAFEKSKDFGIQIMKGDTRQLDEVVVRANKPLYQQQTGGIIVNVENSLLTKGSSALQVLERAPGVVIDHRNNDITLNGKAGVTVMINGKLMRVPVDRVVALLNSMSADDIEKIELLTTPPAGYDAEGSAGIINIVLKKNKKQGTNGSVSLTGGYGSGEKGTGSISLYHNTKSIHLSGSYSFSHNNTYSDMFITSSQNMPVLGGRLNVLVWDTTKSVQNNHEASLGFDAKLNSKTLLGGSVIYNGSNASSTNYSRSTYNILPDSLLLFDGKTNTINRWKNLLSSIYLEKEIRNGEKMNVDMDYLYFKNYNPSDVRSSFLHKDGSQAGNNDSLFSPFQKGLANTSIRVGVAKMDYTKQLTKKLKLEAGLKGSYTAVSSLSGIESLVNGTWVGIADASNSIVMKEGLAAVYTSITSQINSSVNLVAGVRYEYSYTNMNNSKTKENLIKRRLGMLFPNVSFSRKLNENSDLQVSYTKRIGRPSYNDLASYVGYSGPSAVYTGNPLLKPAITNTIKLGYNYRGYSFAILLSRDDNPIARYQITESPSRDLLYISPQNIAWQNNITFQTNLPWKVNNWWNMNYGFVGGLRQFKADHTLQPVEKTYFGYSVNFNESFQLPRRYFVELSGWYNAASYNGSIKVDGFGVLDVGLKKELKNKTGSFQLSVTVFLRSMRINTYYGTLTREAFSIKNHVNIHTESTKFPIIKLTYTRSFGSGIMKANRKQDAGSKDESERIRKD